jgi:hypothetical protein
VDVLDREGAAGAAAARRLGAVGVAQDDPDLGPAGVLCLGPVLDGAGGAVQAGAHGDVGEMSAAGGVQPHRAVEAGAVEKVVPVDLAHAVRGVLDDARRDRLEAEGVVDHDRDQRLGAGLDVLGDLGLEGV